jgi:hypothetical protein
LLETACRKGFSGSLKKAGLAELRHARHDLAVTRTGNG